MENPRYPNFLIAGAAKCGTTSLYNYLNQHPEIYFPDLKEPSFLALPALKFPHKGPGDWTNDNKIVKDIHQYTSLYQGADSEKRLGDASPNTFFYYQESIPNIKKLLGDIPIIIILRNPVDIVISSHRYLSRDSRENIPLEEAFIESDLRFENNFYFLWNYVQLGLLSKRVNAFKQNFTKVFVLSIDNLINNPQEYLMRLCTFLEVENSFNFSFGTRYNQSGIPNNFFLKWTLSRKNKLSYYTRKLLLRYFKRKDLEVLATKFMAKTHYSVNVRKTLSDFYNSEIKELSQILGQNFDS